jgi:hypothetical protein
MALIQIRDLLNCFRTVLTNPRIVSALLGRVGLYVVVQLQAGTVRLIREVYYFSRFVFTQCQYVELELLMFTYQECEHSC